MTQINYNAPWHPLKICWVGISYGKNFYDPIKNDFIRHSLQRIAEETEEDYQNLINVLMQFGVDISRPTIDDDLTILDFVDVNNGKLDYKKTKSFTLIPRPPMQPRDSMLVVGDTLVATNQEAHWFNHQLPNLTGNVVISTNNFDAPAVTVIGKDLIVDCRDYPWVADYVQELFPDHRVTPVFIGGHNDAVFCPIAPGVILSTQHHSNYTKSFPGWTVKYIQNQSWNAIPDWRTFKHSNVGKWWVPEQINSDDFSNFVKTWLDHWLGYVKETVFDINMLQIDERTILVNNYNKEVFDFLKLHNIEPIITPFRHRFFWDGGIHCITCDIHRQGNSDVYIAR
jgi:hypothetical protein